MRKTNVFIALVLCITLIGCFEIQFGNSIKGNWTLIGYVDHIFTEDTSYTREDFYDPAVDQCYLAMIIEITDSLMIVNSNDFELEYSADTMYTVSFNEDSLYLSDIGWEDSLTLAYYYNDEHHLVWIVESNDDYIHEMHFDKYKGEIPPDSWINELQDDNYEPDGDIGNATSLRLNSRQSHTLTENDSDYYKIHAKAGRS